MVKARVENKHIIYKNVLKNTGSTILYDTKLKTIKQGNPWSLNNGKVTIKFSDPNSNSRF